MHKANLLYISTVMAIILGSSPAFAMPPQGVGATPHSAAAEEKFKKMDSNANGAVSWDEFAAFYPQMQKAAFEAIDSSGNGTLEQQEWVSFTAGHSMNRNPAAGAGGTAGMGMPPSGMTMPPKGMGMPPAGIPSKAREGQDGSAQKASPLELIEKPARQSK